MEQLEKYTQEGIHMMKNDFERTKPYQKKTRTTLTNACTYLPKAKLLSFPKPSGASL